MNPVSYINGQHSNIVRYALVCNSGTNVMKVTKFVLNGFKLHSTEENAGLVLKSSQEPMVG